MSLRGASQPRPHADLLSVRLDLLDLVALLGEENGACERSEDTSEILLITKLKQQLARMAIVPAICTGEMETRTRSSETRETLHHHNIDERIAAYVEEAEAVSDALSQLRAMVKDYSQTTEDRITKPDLASIKSAALILLDATDQPPVLQSYRIG